MILAVFIGGVLIGFWCGIFVAGLCLAARNGDEWRERWRGEDGHVEIDL